MILSCQKHNGKTGDSMRKRKPYKSVAICPVCHGRMIFREPAKKEALLEESHLIAHYTVCPSCQTKCRTTTHSVVMRRGNAPSAGTEATSTPT